MTPKRGVRCAKAQDEDACNQQDSLGVFHTSHLHHLTTLHAAPYLHCGALFLLSLGRQVLHHLAVPLDPRRVVHFLTEDDRRGGNANDLAVEDFVSYPDQISLVVRSVDHGNETLLRANDTLELHLIDEESRDSGRTLPRLDFRSGTDERLERIAAALRVVAIGLAGRRLLED